MNLLGGNPRGKEFVTRTDLVLRNLPFSIADIAVIQCETLVTEVEKYKKQVTFYNQVWTQENKYCQERATEQDKKIKQHLKRTRDYSR